MRGILLSASTVNYVIAVEYLIEETGVEFEGGNYHWEGSFVPSLPLRVNPGAAYVLELEDGRRGRITIVRQRDMGEQGPLCWFNGHAGLGEEG
jgi:hypothetical protein